MQCDLSRRKTFGDVRQEDAARGTKRQGHTGDDAVLHALREMHDGVPEGDKHKKPHSVNLPAL